MKRILITGGAGFIGLNITQYLLAQKQYKITVFDNLSSGSLALLQQVVEAGKGKVENSQSDSLTTVNFCEGDIRDGSAVDQVVANQDIIIHLAAETGVIPSLKDPFKDAEVNIMGTLNLLHASSNHKVKCFIQASSAAPLGKQKPPFDESKLPAPISPYGASKLAAEAYCSAFSNSFGLSTCILRFSNVYGPHSYHKGSVVAHFYKKIINNDTLLVYGDGDQSRDFMYVEDIARVMGLIMSMETNKMVSEIFQMGSGEETTINSLIDHMRHITGHNVRVEYKDARAGEIKRNFTSIKKVQERIGFEPKYKINEGLSRTWEWFLNQ